MLGEKAHAKARSEILVLAKENEFASIEFFGGLAMLENLVDLASHERVFAGNGLIGEPVVGISLGEADVVGDDTIGDGLELEEASVLSEVTEVEGILVANAVGIAKETVVEAVEKVLVLGHALVDDVFLGKNRGCNDNDYLALESGLGLAAKESAQDWYFAEHGYAVHGFLRILGD